MFAGVVVLAGGVWRYLLKCLSRIVFSGPNDAQYVSPTFMHGL